MTARVAAALAVTLAFGGPAAAQVARPEQPRGADTAAVRADTTRRDTARAGRGVGLPTRPTRSFAQPDSVVRALMALPNFRVTRYSADSVQLLADEREIRLSGHALIEREGSTLESDTARYVEERCALYASGGPRLFDPTGVLVGEGMQYDACNRAGIVASATTSFLEGSATWFLRGNLAVDNQEDRSYGLRSTVTSCDLPDPHYHFAAREVKWIGRQLMVARPAVLYVGDVPVLWMPFIFQDMRRGRRSGMIPPQFGLNDIVRNSPNYRRHLTNLGYYWAMSDYSDAQVTMDWYAQRFIALNGRLRYRWMDRFIAGGLALQEMRESGGSSSRRISWSHQQQFSLASSLTASLDYASSSRVISRNAVDPVLAVATIDSRINFQRRYDWGMLNVGGSRTQSLDRPQVSTTFPTVNFTPQPVALSRNVVWSPGFSLTNSFQNNVGPGVPVFPAPGRTDTVLGNSRSTSISFATPLRIGRWNWANSVSITDEWSDRREVVTVYPDPADSSQRFVRTYAETFQTGIDWNTGINLPVLFQGRWNLQPALQIVNTTGGPFLIRNRFTDGGYVSQGKRLQFAASVSPTLFGLFGGIGPVARVRHAISPVMAWSYAPAADVPEDYARAISRGGPVNLRSLASHTVSIGLSQNFEAKLRPPEDERADTAAAREPREGRKIKLLSIQSDALVFDLEQARRPGRTAWVTDSWGNTISSDLIRGFQVRLAHDLWEGPVGVVGSRFRPTLTSVTTAFAITGNTLRSLGSVLGLHADGPVTAQQTTPDTLPSRSPTEAGRDFSNAFSRGPVSTRYTAVDRLAPAGMGFNASMNYSLQRTRLDPVSGGTSTVGAENQILSGQVTFSPTRHWNVSWRTSYNVTRSEFSDHVLRLDRRMHDWRASFTFVKSPNGNFLFSFFIQLIDQPDIKLDYDQRNIR